MGLNVTAFSYAGNMWLCAVSCREMLPDPSFFADCLRTAFEQMKEAAAREAAFTVAEMAALAPVEDDRIIEGKVARKPARRRVQAKAAPRAVKAKAAGQKRRSRKVAAPGKPGLTAMRTRDRMPAELRRALTDVFGDPVDDVVLREHSWFAKLHGHATATTRRNTIYLRGSVDDFFASPELLLHEYFHVLRQWNRGRMNVARLPARVVSARLLAEPLRAAGPALREIAARCVPGGDGAPGSGRLKHADDALRRGVRRDRGRRRPCRHRGRARLGATRCTHAARHAEHRGAGADELQPGDRRHRQGAPRPRDRCARRRDGARDRPCRHPVPHAQREQGPGRPRDARAGRPHALQARRSARSSRTSRTCRCSRPRSPTCRSSTAALPASSPRWASSSPRARSCSRSARSSAARSTSASNSRRADARAIRRRTDSRRGCARCRCASVASRPARRRASTAVRSTTPGCWCRPAMNPCPSSRSSGAATNTRARSAATSRPRTSARTR